MKIQKLMFLLTLGLVVSLGYSCGDDDGDGGDPMDCDIQKKLFYYVGLSKEHSIIKLFGSAVYIGVRHKSLIINCWYL